MKVIGIGILIAFGAGHTQAKTALNAWLKVAKQAKWKNLMEVREVYPSADGGVKEVYTVFNVRGNHYRLITIINYESQTIAVTNVFTHAEYDRWSRS